MNLLPTRRSRVASFLSYGAGRLEDVQGAQQSFRDKFVKRKLDTEENNVLPHLDRTDEADGATKNQGTMALQRCA